MGLLMGDESAMPRRVNGRMGICAALCAIFWAPPPAFAGDWTYLQCESSPRYPKVSVSFSGAEGLVTVDGDTVKADISEQRIEFIQMGYSYVIDRVSGSMEAHVVGKPDTVVRFKCELAARMF